MLTVFHFGCVDMFWNLWLCGGIKVIQICSVRERTIYDDEKRKKTNDDVAIILRSINYCWFISHMKESSTLPYISYIINCINFIWSSNSPPTNSVRCSIHSLMSPFLFTAARIDSKLLLASFGLIMFSANFMSRWWRWCPKWESLQP